MILLANRIVEGYIRRRLGTIAGEEAGRMANASYSTGDDKPNLIHPTRYSMFHLR